MFLLLGTTCAILFVRDPFWDNFPVRLPKRVLQKRKAHIYTGPSDPFMDTPGFNTISTGPLGQFSLVIVPKRHPWNFLKFSFKKPLKGTIIPIFPYIFPLKRP